MFVATGNRYLGGLLLGNEKVSNQGSSSNEKTKEKVSVASSFLTSWFKKKFQES